MFYAITRNRDAVVLHLLALGASVLLVNNKGQTPYSLGLSHLQPTTMRVIEQRERTQLLSLSECSMSQEGTGVSGGEIGWVNYYKSHCDGRAYGDLDPRFVQNSWSVSATDAVRVLLIPCCPEHGQHKGNGSNETQPHTGQKSSSEHLAPDHYHANSAKGSRLHQLVYIYQSKTTVIDTIRLTKSLQFTTLESRTEKLSRSKDQQVQQTEALTAKAKKFHESPPMLSKNDVTPFLQDMTVFGRITGVKAAKGGQLLARLSPIMSVDLPASETDSLTATETEAETASIDTMTVSEIDSHRFTGKDLAIDTSNARCSRMSARNTNMKSVDGFFLFLETVISIPPSTTLATSTTAAASTTTSSTAVPTIAAVVYLHLNSECLSTATCDVAWHGPQPTRQSDIRDLIGCDVEVSGSCQPTSLHSHSKSGNIIEKKKIPMWRFDVHAHSLVYIQHDISAQFSNSPAENKAGHNMLQNITRKASSCSVFPIIVEANALNLDHVRSFHRPVTLSPLSLLHSNDGTALTSRDGDSSKLTCNSNNSQVLSIQDILHIRSGGQGVDTATSESLVVVDSLKSIQTLREAIQIPAVMMALGDSTTLPQEIYGIDCEWKANNVKKQQRHSPKQSQNASYVSVLQLSTRTQAFVIDLQQLIGGDTHTVGPVETKLEIPSLPSEATALSELAMELNSVLLPLFTNPNVLIIGYGVKQDLENLNDSFPHMPCFNFRTMALLGSSPSLIPNINGSGSGENDDKELTSSSSSSKSAVEDKRTRRNVLDLQPCVDQIMRTRSSSSTSTSVTRKQNRGNHYSLSVACESFLHKRLSKEMQLSDWSARPLSQQQVEYAAIDALVLCLLFDVLYLYPMPSEE